MAPVAVLPKNVSFDSFMQAVAEYQAILGPDNVIVDAERLVPYERMMIPGKLSDYQSSGALIPSTVADIQRILAVCNKYVIPVWPISTGGNLGYGERLPSIPGQMVLDLGRMNKLVIDTELSLAIVEPGVTYHQLYQYLNANNIPLWLAVPGPGPIVGPIGQALERGQGYTSYGEQFESLCGMEVVLADGSVLRTGMGGVEGSTAAHAFKYGYGPYLDGMFTQSNFGIVTKIGLWLVPRPETVKIFAASFPHFEDAGRAVECGRTLKLRELVDGPMLCGMPLGMFQMQYGERTKIKQDPGPITREWFANYLKSTPIGQYGVNGALAGTPGDVEARYAEIKRVCASFGATQTVDDLLLQLNPMYPHIRDSRTGTPDLGELNMLNWVPGGGVAWFAPICPSRASEVNAQVDLGWKIMEDHGFDYNGGFFLNGRSAIHAISLHFDKTSEADNARAHTCFDELVTKFAAKGWGQYRTNSAFMAKTSDTYGQAQQAFNRTIKTALDPKGIIAPGKSGIVLA